MEFPLLISISSISTLLLVSGCTAEEPGAERFVGVVTTSDGFRRASRSSETSSGRTMSLVWMEHLRESDRPLLAAVVHGNEGDVRLENGDIGRGFRIGDADLVGHGCLAQPRHFAGDAEDGAIADAVAELYLVHGDGDELAVGELGGSGDPRGLIDP